MDYGVHRVNLGGSDIYFRNFKLQLGFVTSITITKSFSSRTKIIIFPVKPEGFFSYYGLAHLKPLMLLPDTGMSLKVDYSLYTDNLITYNDGAPFSAIGLDFDPCCPSPAG